jgi:hypothetical protein
MCFLTILYVRHLHTPSRHSLLLPYLFFHTATSHSTFLLFVSKKERHYRCDSFLFSLPSDAQAKVNILSVPTSPTSRVYCLGFRDQVVQKPRLASACLLPLESTPRSSCVLSCLERIRYAQSFPFDRVNRYNALVATTPCEREGRGEGFGSKSRHVV